VAYWRTDTIRQPSEARTAFTPFAPRPITLRSTMSQLDIKHSSFAIYVVRTRRHRLEPEWLERGADTDVKNRFGIKLNSGHSRSPVNTRKCLGSARGLEVSRP